MGAGQTIGGLGGAAIGSSFGPIGGIAGGYLGSAIGGGLESLFGGSSAPNPQAAQQRQAFEDEQKERQRLAYIAGGGGPSVAGLQLGQGLDQINRGAASQAAGATGNNGVLAHYGAIQAGANAGAATNQAAAIARGKEIQDATMALSGLTGSALGTTTSGANQAQANATTATANNRDFGTKLLGAGLQGISQGGAFNASSAPSAAEAPGGQPFDPDALMTFGG